MAATEQRDVEHLSGFDCENCGHPAMAHYRNPGCRNWETCRCNADPLCWCGSLSSKHA
jgi:lipopolysaccharide biosynthesis regulator YciM